jgi:hypothetical protein
LIVRRDRLVFMTSPTDRPILLGDIVGSLRGFGNLSLVSLVW